METLDDEYDPEMDITALYDNETSKDSVISSQKTLKKAGRRPLPRNPMAVAPSVAASVAPFRGFIITRYHWPTRGSFTS